MGRVAYRGIGSASLVVLLTFGGPPRVPAPTPPVEPCAKAAALQVAGLVEEARKEYEAALATPATASCARGGLLALGADRSLALVRQLDREGLDAEAKKLLIETLETYPATEVPSDLRHLLHPRALWWENFVERATPFVNTAVDIGVPALIVVIVALLVLTRLPRRLRIGTFTGPSSDTANGIAAEFPALLRARIDTLTSADMGRITYAPYTGGPVAVPATVTQTLPQVGYLDALIHLAQHLFPTNDRAVSGVLHGPSARGVGVTVTIESRRGGPRETETFWADDLPAVALAGAHLDSYLPFVGFVAAWSLHQFRRRRFPALGTTEPRSYATFAAAARQGDRKQHPELVQDAYYEAIKLDPANSRARFNLAMTQLNEGQTPERAIAELTTLRAHFTTAARGEPVACRGRSGPRPVRRGIWSTGGPDVVVHDVRTRGRAGERGGEGPRCRPARPARLCLGVRP